MLRDMVCVTPTKDVKISDLIVLPENTTGKPECTGTVMFVGPKCTFVKPGDFVWFEQFDHTVGPHESIVIAENEILARRER